MVKTAKTGGPGGFDYIYADVSGRRLYIPRGAVQGPAPSPARVTVFNLDTLAPVGEIADTRANGVAVDTKSGHGFASSKPVAMWDTKTLKVIKTIDVDGRPDGILADPFNQRIYVFSHAAPHATVIDAKAGTVLGTIDLGGAPEQAATDGKGHVYVDVSDKANVAVIDAKTMKVTAHYDLGDKGSGLAGLALDVKNHILFVACRNSGAPQEGPGAKPMMVILNADDGEDPRDAAARRRLRRRGVQSGHDGSVQHARQRHDDDRQGNQPDQLRRRAEPRHDGRREDADARHQDEPRPDDGRRVRPGAGGASRRRAGRARQPWPDDARFVLDSGRRPVASPPGGAKRAPSARTPRDSARRSFGGTPATCV